MSKTIGLRPVRSLRRILSAALACIMLVTLCAQPGYAASTTSTYSFSFTYDQSDARSMLSLINDFRTGDDAWQLNADEERVEITGLGELTYDYGLEAIAMQRAAEICTYWSHTRPNGGDCFDLYDFNYGYAGENLAAGSATAERAFVQLQETDENYAGQGHRRNMLNNNFNYIGIAKCKIGGYWFYVQEFSKNPSGTASSDAYDGKKDVPITFLTSLIEDSLSLSCKNDSISMNYGDTAELPEISITMSPAGEDASIWPDGTEITAAADDCTFTVEDDSVISISGSTITALKADSTTIQVTQDGKETTIWVTVEPLDLSEAVITLDQTSFAYDGEAHQPGIRSVVLDGTTLTEGTDYQIADYSDWLTDVGEGYVTIEGIGNYTGSASARFTVGGTDISDAVITLEQDTFTYNDEDYEPAFTVTLDGVTLTDYDDYYYEYTNNCSAGTATVTVTGTGNYCGTATANFTIEPLDISGGTICYLDESYWYTGEAQTPEPAVEIGDFYIGIGADLTVTYENNVNVGTASLTLTGQGNFTGSITGTFEIKPVDIADCNIDGLDYDYVYTGEPICPEPVITFYEMTLVKDTDYTLSYTDNTEAGDAILTITGKGNYTGSWTHEFSISKTTFNNAEITLSQTDYIYSGEACTPEVTVVLKGQTLIRGTDYTLTFEDNIDAGTAYAVITGIGLYDDTVYKAFTINPRTLRYAEITQESLTYTGQTLTPVLTIIIDGRTLTDSDYYTKSKTTLKNAGTYEITVTGVGNYTGDITTNVTVDPAQISTAKVSGLAESYEYTGEAIVPDLSLTWTSGKYVYSLVNGTDYECTLTNNIDPGKAGLTISGKGNFAGDLTYEFEITARDIGNAIADFGSAPIYFTDEPLEPDFVLYDGTTKLAEGVDYQITGYSDNTEPGWAEVTYEGIGKYTGTGFALFQIELPGPDLESYDTKASSVVIHWTASVGADGYQIYRKIGSGSYGLLDDVYGGDITTYTDTTVKSGKKYTYKIRAFRGDETTTSEFSNEMFTFFLSRPKISSTVNTAKGITVKWAKVTGADSYAIYRNGTYVTSVESDTLSYTDTGARTNGKKYTYTVLAGKDLNQTSHTSVLSAKKIAYYVSRPAKPTLKNSSAGKLTVIWKKNSKATGYQVKYVVGTTTKTVNVSGAATVKKVLTVKKGKTYKVYVRAYKTVSKVKYYSAWSPANKLKITK